MLKSVANEICRFEPWNPLVTALVASRGSSREWLYLPSLRRFSQTSRRPKIVIFGSLTLNTTLTLCLPNQRRQKLFHLIIYTVYGCGCGAVLRLLLQLRHLKTSLIVLQTVSPKSAFKQLKIKMGTFSKELMRYKLPILKTLGVQS